MKTLIAFQNITLIDGTGSPALPDATVGVRDGRIIYAGPARKWQPSLDEDIINLDFAGKVVMPGLIDCHIHLAAAGESNGRIEAAGTAAMTLKILNNARKDLAAGITTARDLGGWNELEFDVRRAIQDGQFTGPRLLLAGRLLSTSAAEADRFAGMVQIVDEDEIRKAVREQLARGADLISLAVGAAALVDDEMPEATLLDIDEICAVLEEAVALGKRVAARAHGLDGIRKAVEAGVHSIEYGTYLHRGPEVIKDMAARGTYLVPALAASHVIQNASTPRVPRWLVSRLVDMQVPAIKSLRAAYKAGVPIAMGSGAGTPLNVHGGNGYELSCMEQAGLKPMDCLVAATSAAAGALGWGDRIGSIEEGKLADLLVLDSNPLDDLNRLADKKTLRAVFLDGMLVARQPGDAYPRTVLAKDCLTVGQ